MYLLQYLCCCSSLLFILRPLYVCIIEVVVPLSWVNFCTELCNPGEYVIIPLGTNGGRSRLTFLSFFLLTFLSFFLLTFLSFFSFSFVIFPFPPILYLFIHIFSGVTEDNLSSFLLSKAGLKKSMQVRNYLFIIPPFLLRLSIFLGLGCRNHLYRTHAICTTDPNTNVRKPSYF
jgi:hypothetical protein